MTQQLLQVEIITQEEQVLSRTFSKVVAPAANGEVTILPNHIPLFTRLNDGIIKLIEDSNQIELAILGGFMDVSPNNHVTILADAAIKESDINLAKAEAARKRAQDTMKQKVTDVEFKQAEASLRRALLELKVARRHKARSGLPSSGSES